MKIVFYDILVNDKMYPLNDGKNRTDIKTQRSKIIISPSANLMN